METNLECLGSFYIGELLKELNARGVRLSRIAEVSHRKESYLKAVTYDSSKKLTLHCFLRILHTFEGIETLKHISKEMNCVVYQVPNVCLSSGLVLRKAVTVMKEAVKTFEIVEASIADDNYTDEEKEETYAEIEKTMESLLELKHCLREMKSF